MRAPYPAAVEHHRELSPARLARTGRLGTRTQQLRTLTGLRRRDRTRQLEARSRAILMLGKAFRTQVDVRNFAVYDLCVTDRSQILMTFLAEHRIDLNSSIPFPKRPVHGRIYSDERRAWKPAPRVVQSTGACARTCRTCRTRRTRPTRPNSVQKGATLTRCEMWPLPAHPGGPRSHCPPPRKVPGNPLRRCWSAIYAKRRGQASLRAR